MIHNLLYIYIYLCTCLTGLGQYHLRPLYQSIKVDAQDVEYLPTNMPEEIEIVQRIKREALKMNPEMLQPIVMSLLNSKVQNIRSNTTPSLLEQKP